MSNIVYDTDKELFTAVLSSHTLCSCVTASYLVYVYV